MHSLKASNFLARAGDCKKYGAAPWLLAVVYCNTVVVYAKKG